MGISVLMSVYKKEKAEYLRKALQSIFNQSLQCDEVILVKDGELSEELEAVISEFSVEHRNLKTHALKTNVQLGRALAVGVDLCENEFIARMDTDDIADPERLQIQYTFLLEHPEIAVVGGNIAEFTREGEILREKSMPSEHLELFKYGKLRNPLNHMTVMFRKSAVLECGNYCHFPLLEDYHLWSRMLAKGYRIGNISKVLVNARIDQGFSSKRGGWNYFLQYKELRQLQYRIGYTNKIEFVCGLLCSFVMTMQPIKMRNWVYKHVLRR